MLRFLSRPGPLALALAAGTGIPVLSALVLVFQIPTGTYPADSARLATTPFSWFLHALAGAAFGISGPLQFLSARRPHLRRWHRLSGWTFVLSGTLLGLSGLSLLVQLPSQRTLLVDLARGLFGLTLLIALVRAMGAIWMRDIAGHRAWTIRAYALGMGVGAISLLFFPLYLITGSAPQGLVADLLFVALWLLVIVFAEFVLRYPGQRG